MADKVYLSNAFAPLSMAWQEVVLAASVPGWPDAVEVFRDLLHEPLVERAKMLRMADSNQQVTYVASLSVLARDENDFRSVVAEVLAKRGVIIAIDEALTLNAASGLDQIVQAWKQARKKKRIAPAQQFGSKVSAARKKAKAAEGVDKIRQYWGMPSEEWPTARLQRMAGTDERPLSYNTIVAHIGYGRETARQRYLKALRCQAGVAESELT